MAKHTGIGAEIVRLHTEGKTYKEIKAALGCSLATISYHVGAGQKEKLLERTRNRSNMITRHVQKVKQEAVCADCGENYPYWIMQFDHVRGEKKFNIGSRKEKPTLEAVIEEIAKCDIVCANCHFNRTHMRLIKSGSDTIDLSELYGE